MLAELLLKALCPGWMPGIGGAGADGDHLWNSNYVENLEQRWVKIRQDAGSSEEVTVVTLFRGKVCIRGLTF